MKLTIELTDLQLSTVKDALKVRYADVDAIWKGSQLRSAESDYARRILIAREALGLSNGTSECVSDVENIPQPETITVV